MGSQEVELNVMNGGGGRLVDGGQRWRAKDGEQLKTELLMGVGSGRVGSR